MSRVLACQGSPYCCRPSMAQSSTPAARASRLSSALAVSAASFPFRLKARFVLPVFYAAPEEIEPKAGEFGQP